MTKIYEALENARREQGGYEKPEGPSLKPEVPSLHEYDLKTSNLNMEEEMIELYRTIDSLFPNSQKKAIQFIGSRNDEGTSTIVREFARVLVTDFGKSVLLLDADADNPAQLPFFGFSQTYSLEDAFRNKEPIGKALCRIGNSSLFVSLFTKPHSSVIQIPDSLMNSNLWEKLKQKFDFILVDSPPAVTSSVGPAISGKMDGVVLVIEAEITRRPVADSVKEKIIKNGGKILGMVFNKRRYHTPNFIYKRL